MKLIHTIIYVFLLVIACRAQNNLIHNAGFEDYDEDYGTSPCKPAQVENMQVWEDDHNFVFNFLPCNYLNCSNTNCSPCAKLHTPDWYKYYSQNSLDYYYFKEKIGSTTGGGNVLSPVTARNGIGYSGMRPGEVLEQKFFDNNPISGSKKYTYSMYIRIPNDLSTYVPIFGMGQIENSSQISELSYNINSVFSLNIYLSTQKIKYSNSITTCGNADLSNDNFKDFTTNHVVKIKNFQISPSEYSYGQWHKLTFEFTCPSNYNYKWLGIEQDYDDQNLMNNGYILIDDVSLIESCELSCSPTSGMPNPVIGIPTSGYNASLQVSNVQNVEKLKMEIFPITGQQSIFTVNFNYTNGITGNIYWNGELGAGGTAAIGTYICKLTCENDCGLYDFSQQFVNVGASAPYGPNRSLTKIEPKEINPCCVIDYTLQDRTFNSAKNFQVKEHIFVNGNVHSVASGNLELVAGKSIEVINEFEASPTSLFSAKIVECADAHRLSNTTLTDRDFTFYEKNDEDKIAIPSFKKDLITVLPNPSNGCFNIKTVDKSEKTVCVINSLGLIVYSSKFSSEIFDINLNLPSGIYFIEVISKGIKSQQKIIIED